MTRKILVTLSEYGYWGEELIGPLDVFIEQGWEYTFVTPRGRKPPALPPSMEPGFVDPRCIRSSPTNTMLSAPRKSTNRRCSTIH